MRIQFSDKQFKELLFLVMIGSYVRDGVLDSRGEYDNEKHDILEKYLLERAKDEGHDHLVEDFKDSLIPSDELCRKEEELIAEYNDEEFWFELGNRLGRRDFEKSMTDEEREKVEKEGWFPERVNEFYKKYSDEFEKRGIERLEIKED